MLLRWLGDVLSPAKCAACSLPVARTESIFCPPCLATVEPCSQGGDVAAFAHYGGAVATAIQRLKYEEAPYLARPLGALATMAFVANRIESELIVPVPLHPRRLALRGYNQSALLGAHVASHLGLPLLTTVLARIADTPPQADLSREARLSNVGGAFRVTRPELVRGRAVAILDDVATTGATLRACTERLLEAGATRVTSVVVARTIFTRPQFPR